MTTKDKSSVDVDFAVCSYKKGMFLLYIKRNIFFIQYLYGYVIVTLMLSCKRYSWIGDIEDKARADLNAKKQTKKKCELKFWLNRCVLRQQTRA